MQACWLKFSARVIGILLNFQHTGIFMASKTNPFTFLQQVRTEVSKVTWPTRGETVTTTIMVFIMVIFAALFFFALDQILGWGVGLLVNLGS